ncbi:hypothetical protein IE53DRAFT_383981 [Violaceomyces palustris]|uniref:Uncharacterized protein n=1 Tax=Violaceomyces palustris TaxID=1673888 RepID=A0ACD0P632_9BASI|nr:hypothetical protein IE53DRAFT_383981 [Violaceomyces palustris]
MAPPHSRAPFQPALIELPLLLSVMGFSAALMGLSGSDIHFFSELKQKASINNLVEVHDNGILKVDLALLIISAITFAFSILSLFLACAQFPKRRGEYTGKGTYGYFLVGFVLLVLSGAYTGIAGAYTAYAVQKKLSFSPGSAYSTPFTTGQQTFLRSLVFQFSAKQSTTTPTSTTQSSAALGVWSQVTNIDQLNAQVTRYLDYRTYRATVAICWVTLGTVFFVMVVHFALPFLLKYLGMTRAEEKDAPARASSRITRPMAERRDRRGYQDF